MQEGESLEGHLRKMAAKCRLIADDSTDDREPASLRMLAQEYEKAAEALRQTTADIAPAPPDLRRGQKPSFSSDPDT